MIKDFKCKSCGIVFTADDEQEVECPSCNSDNIDYFQSKKGPNKTILWAGVAFIAAIGIGIGLKFIFNGRPDVEDIAKVEDEVNIEEAQIQAEEDQIKDYGEPIREVTLTSNNDFKADPKTKTYSFSFNGNNLPEYAEKKYELYDHGTGKLVMSTPDGKFEKVPPATDQIGSYDVRLSAKAGDKTWNASNVVTGCIAFPEAQLDKLSVAQVQALIKQMLQTNNSAVLSANPHFVKNLKFSYKGLRNDDFAPTNFSKLNQQVNMGIWSGMTVVGLRYDDNTNQIVEMTIQPVYAD